jgi:hypothetical protein
MPEAIQESVREFLKLLDDKLVAVSSDASAIILFVMAVGLLSLLFMIAGKKPSPAGEETIAGPADHEKTIPVNLERIIDELNGEIARRDITIKKLRSGEDHTPIEQLYFAVNGIVNSAVLLNVALFLWEFFEFRNRPPKQQIGSLAVAHGLGRVMIVLAATTVCSVIIVYMSRSTGGQSYEKINRSFFISLGVSVAGFLVFALWSQLPFTDHS